MYRDANRLPLMPDLASADEQGLTDFDVSSWNALAAGKDDAPVPGKSSIAPSSRCSARAASGHIAAPCTDATRSTRIRAASCTAPKSRASNDQRKRGARGARMSSHGTAETNGDVPIGA